LTATATFASAAGISTLVNLMAEFYAESGYPLDRLWATNSFSVLLNDPSLGSVWLLLDDGEAAGYAVLTVRFSMEHGGRDAFVDDLFVRSKHRRRGVGRAAMCALIGECERRGVLALHVEVGPDNAPANALYSRFGLSPRADRRQVLTAAFE
jgi:GNAT superfamily N-acetyltransferase